MDVSSYPANFTAFVNGPVSGLGGLTKTSGGILALDASNSYQGGTTINGGAIQVGNANALGSTTAGLVINSGTLDLNSYGATVGALSGSSTGVITTTANSSVTLTTGGSSNTTYAGQIQNGAGTVGLTQAGSGALTLSASSGFTGATNVNSGTLIVSGSLSGTPTVNVASNATLEVDGLLNHSASTTINGALQGIGSVGGFTASGGAINPGLTNANSQTSSGNLTAAGSVTLSNSTAFNIRLGMLASGTDSDSLTVTGANTISLNDATLNLTLGSYMNNPALQNKFYAIIIGGAGSTGVGSDIFAGLPEGQMFTTANGWEFTIMYASAPGGGALDSGNDVVLELDAIPEPGTWAAMLSGFAMLLIVQRARRRKLKMSS
jgi:autotransporter-associated beta strand protein